jgi:hypothetical protein
MEFVQQIIARMSGIGFQVKSWSVTLSAGLFALSATGANVSFAVLAFIPILVFWGLDAWFLQAELQYRDLYDHLRTASDKDRYPSDRDRYDLNPATFKIQKKYLLDVALRGPLPYFHITLLVAAVIVIVVLQFVTQK